MQNLHTYTLNPSAPLPYGLWLNLPFRTKGSTAIRSEAKRYGARFLPSAKPHQWWLPSRFITQTVVDWFNSHNAIVGERQAPEYNTTIKWSDIYHTMNFTVILRLPYEQKDIAKADGAFWDSYERAWYFPKKNFSEALFNKYAGMKAIGRVIYPASNVPSLLFFIDDMGTATPKAVPATPVAAAPAPVAFATRAIYTMQKHYDHHRLGGINMLMKFLMHTDSTVTVLPYINGKQCHKDATYDGIMVDTVMSLTGVSKNMVGFNTLLREHIKKEDARVLWDSLVMQGFLSN